MSSLFIQLLNRNGLHEKNSQHRRTSPQAGSCTDSVKNIAQTRHPSAFCFASYSLRPSCSSFISTYLSSYDLIRIPAVQGCTQKTSPLSPVANSAFRHSNSSRVMIPFSRSLQP